MAKYKVGGAAGYILCSWKRGCHFSAFRIGSFEPLYNLTFAFDVGTIDTIL